MASIENIEKLSKILGGVIYPVLMIPAMYLMLNSVETIKINGAKNNVRIEANQMDIVMLKNLHLTRSPQPPERLKPPGDLIQPERRIRIKDVEFRR